MYVYLGRGGGGGGGERRGSIVLYFSIKYHTAPNAVTFFTFDWNCCIKKYRLKLYNNVHVRERRDSGGREIERRGGNERERERKRELRVSG